MKYDSTFKSYVPDEEGVISLSDLADRWGVSKNDIDGIVTNNGNYLLSALLQRFKVAKIIGERKLYSMHNATTPSDLNNIFVCMRDVVAFENRHGLVSVTSCPKPGTESAPTNCDACRADSSHVVEWVKDVECAVSLTNKLMKAGTPGSTAYHEKEWLDLRGAPRKRAFEAFRRALPDHLKEADPRKK